MGVVQNLYLVIGLLFFSHSLQTDPCTTYLTGSTSVCVGCTSLYSLLLFNNINTICAPTPGPSMPCVIDSNYPVQQAYQTANSIVYQQTGSYYFNCQSYFWRSIAGTMTQVCSSCQQQDPVASFYLQSVYQLAQGCANCPVAAASQQSVVYLSGPDLYMRECSAMATGQTTPCTFTQFYNTGTKSCMECKNFFPNCAACSATKCILCPINFYNHTAVYDYSTSTSINMCIFNVCPVGTCKNTLTNRCEVSSLTNCQICSRQASLQTCEVCSPGYFILSGGICSQLQLPAKLIYFVKSGISPLLTADIDLIVYNPTMDTISQPFKFIQEALNNITQYQYNQTQANLKTQITAIIYLGVGDHFFFQCDGDESQSTQSEFSLFAKYCDILGARLQKSYSSFDNVFITIQPLYCSLGPSLALDTDPAFKLICLQPGIKPTIYVNNANSQFNISGAMEFQNILFTGINALAVPTNPSNDLSVFSLQLCTVTTEPTGYDVAFKLSASSSMFAYTCIDSWYTAPQRVDMTTLNRRCTLNGNKKFNSQQESTLKCDGDPNSPSFFWQNANGVYSKRRFTLFNLYAFPQHQSTFLIPPSLNLTNCDFQYFLGGYESLINVENNNINQINMTVTQNTVNSGSVSGTSTFYTYNGANKGVRIMISGSNFKNSRFCKGMIVYRKPIYINSRLSFTNYTHIFSLSSNSDQGSYITISQSTFTSMNIFTNVTALAAYNGGVTPNRTLNNGKQLDNIVYKAFIHKGIVLNIEDFGGNVEIFGSTFTRNIHYISEAAVFPRYTTDEMGIEQFRDARNNSEYKITACNLKSQTDINLFTTGISIADDVDQYYDEFERLSVIYISRNRKPMIFSGNTFYRNTGTFGGAISINSPNFRTVDTPYLVIQSCIFQNNQGFFGGNALYMRNTKIVLDQTKICAGGFVDSSNFTNNVGLKAHNGGAISALCQYLDNKGHDDYYQTSSISSMWVALDLIQDLFSTLDSVIIGAGTISVYTFRFSISNSNFYENYSGLKGTAIFFNKISKIRMTNTIFQYNSPTFSANEYQYSPLAIYMTNRPISYFDPNQFCLDEFSFLQNCINPNGQIIDFPRANGAVYIQQCQESFCSNENDYQIVTIINCNFNANELGPSIMSDFPSHDNAASLYINGGMSNTITNSMFNDHYGTYDYYFQYVSSTYGNFFPTNYFQYAHAPVIRIKVAPIADMQVQLSFFTNITNCQFQGNQQMNILGGGKQYYGSLIAYESNYLSGFNYLPVLSISQCTIRDNQFFGNQTSLIYVKQGLLNFTNNTAIGNGFLSANFTKQGLQTGLPFEGYTYYLSQQYGVLNVVGNQPYRNNVFHVIRKNKFQFNFAQQGAAVALHVNSQYVLFEGNKYKHNFALQGAGIYATTGDGNRTTFKFINETFHSMFTQSQGGAISIQSSQVDVLSMYIANSTFTNCWSADGGSIYLSKIAAAIIKNCSFNDNRTFSGLVNKTSEVAPLYVPLVRQLLGFVDQQFLSYLLNNVTRNTGALYLESTLNTQAINFTQFESLRLMNSFYLKFSEILNCSFENLTSTSASAIYIGKGTLLRINSSYPFKGMQHQSLGVI